MNLCYAPLRGLMFLTIEQFYQFIRSVVVCFVPSPTWLCGPYFDVFFAFVPSIWYSWPLARSFVAVNFVQNYNNITSITQPYLFLSSMNSRVTTMFKEELVWSEPSILDWRAQQKPLPFHPLARKTEKGEVSAATFSFIEFLFWSVHSYKSGQETVSFTIEASFSFFCSNRGLI